MALSMSLLLLDRGSCRLTHAHTHAYARWLAHGHFSSSGRVKIAKHAVTGQLAAIKIVPKHALINSRMSINEAGNKAEKILLGIEREIIIMKLIDHPNVMNLYDVWETNGDLSVSCDRFDRAGVY